MKRGLIGFAYDFAWCLLAYLIGFNIGAGHSSPKPTLTPNPTVTAEPIEPVEWSVVPYPVKVYAVRVWPADYPVPGEVVWMDGDRLVANIEAGIPVTITGFDRKVIDNAAAGVPLSITEVE